MLDVLNQAKRFILVAPEIGRVTARCHQLSARVLLVNDVAAQIAQRCFQHVENKFRPRRAAGRTRPQLGAELVLMFRFGKVTEHVRRCAEKNKPTAFVEQDCLVKHLKDFRARLMDCNDDDFVVRHRADDFDNVLGVF